jgi:hypothetical protein
MYKQTMSNTRSKRHPMAETIRGEGIPAFVEPAKTEVIIVRLSKEQKERLRAAAGPVTMSAYIVERLGLGERKRR